MAPSLPFSLIATAIVTFLALIASARAGGSVSRGDFLASITDTSLRQYVAEHFELAEEGRALRAGRQMPNAGERLPPFEIVATSLRDDETPVVLHLDAAPSRQVLILPCSASVHYDPSCQ